MGFTVLGYRVCRCKLSIAADVKDGFISGVASTPSTDAFGHSVCAGAFDRSIKAKGLGGPKGVKLLAGHDWAKLIGVITRLEDALRIEAQLNLDIGYVRDLHSSIVHNGGLSFSVGFALEDFGGAVGDEQPDRLLWQQERDASRLPIRHEAEWRAAPARADLDLAVALDRTGQGRACRPESAATLRRTSQTYARDHLSRCR